MTTVQTLLTVLAKSPDSAIQVMLPDETFVPPHFHVTEVGIVNKDIIDCGGTIRSFSACVLQLWVANDVDHRIDAAKFRRILLLAVPLIRSTDLSMEVEYEGEFFSRYDVGSIETVSSGIVLRLVTKHTACPAPELCVVRNDQKCCETSSCCC